MIRVFINPSANPVVQSIGGIDRVVEAQYKYLPDFDVVVHNSADGVDLIANHATLLEERRGIPMVSHIHGLYWSDYEWPTWTEHANSQVIEAMRRANAVSAPSQWVADAVARGMLFRPEVIYHGVDSDEWTVDSDHSGYILWNKGREDSVSNPRDMQEAARTNPRELFVSTFGMPTSNVKIIGPTNYNTMKKIVQKAKLYLATPRETFGIGTIEALACGVPVVGWDYGGQREIIENGRNGYLAPYGDYDALAECIARASEERDELSKYCREDAMYRWNWPDQIQKYAMLYYKTIDEYKTERPKVSVIVTTHNLARFLEDCLGSVLDQTLEEWEAIVVDDYSGDNPKKVINELSDPRIKYVKTRENVGLSTARNLGIRRSTGKYIICLDADDMLDAATLSILSDSLDLDSSIHIAYGRLDTIGEDGGMRRQNEWPSRQFDWRAQISHLNQLPYASMVRREVFEKSGGYRERDWRAEDASLWTRVTSYGFRASMVTDRPTLIYRFRHDSKSSNEGREHPDRDGDWTSWFPWRTGAKSGRDGEEVYYRNIRPKPSLVPFGSVGKPNNPHLSWPVHHHASPVVSVIIPVAPVHQRHLIDALDSCVAQTITDWEAIVIDDSPDGSMPDVITSHPFARVFHSLGTGASRARNIGLQHARGEFVLFLDADDIIDPITLEDMLTAYVQNGGGYVYCDCRIPNDSKRLDGAHEVVDAIDYDQDLFIRSGYTDGYLGCHSVTALVATADIKQTNGFDEMLAYWEDWAIYLELAKLGIRGIRVPKPLLTYRLDTGIRRKASEVQEGAIRRALQEQYGPYADGVKQMCACTGGAGGQLAQQAAVHALRVINEDTVTGSAAAGNTDEYVKDGKVRLRYIGERMASVPYRGPVSRLTYLAGRDPSSEYVDVDYRDAPHLMRTGDFEIVDLSERERLTWNN